MSPGAPPPGAPRAALSIAAGVGAAALAGTQLWAGRFTCDDAWIAFRYVFHARRGLGWTWNPPPFAPVEGYTSPLWVALLTALDAVGVGVEEGAHALGLLSLVGLVLLVSAAAHRLPLSPALDRVRPAVVAVVGVTVALDGTLATWAGSGLETGLYVLLFVAWVLAATRDARAPVLAGLAALAALTRPDGLLLCAATVALAGWRALQARAPRPLLGLAPLLLVGAHLVARRLTYGVWLPNTWFAKVGPWWPEAGVRHLTWFLVETSWWVWPLVALAALPRLRGLRAGAWVAVGAVAATVAYYALKVGGDHFGFRVWAPLVPLFAVSLPWLVDRVRPGPAALGASLLVLALGRVIPSTHAALQAGHTRLGDPTLLVQPVADHVPPLVRPLGRAWDGLQGWLVPRMVGVRRQQHVVFAEVQRRLHPPLGALDGPSLADGGAIAVQPRGATRPDPTRLPASLRIDTDVSVHEAPTVGVPGAVLPGLVVVDTLGLNDAAVARHGGWRAPRVMAHERIPPEGYVECLRPNVFPALILRSPAGELRGVRGYGARYQAMVDVSAPTLPLPPGWDGPDDTVVQAGLLVVQREVPLTRADIAACLGRFGG